MGNGVHWLHEKNSYRNPTQGGKKNGGGGGTCFHFSSYERLFTGDVADWQVKDFGYIVWHEGSKPELLSQKRWPLLGNALLNASPWQWICTCHNSRNVGSSFFCGVCPKATGIYLELIAIMTVFWGRKVQSKPEVVVREWYTGRGMGGSGPLLLEAIA
jgi:hypothetical protein